MPLGTLDFPAWDPVILDLPGPLAIRWYGLGYIVGFAVGQYILVRLARARLLAIEPEEVGDLVLYLVFGVLLGGRLGYALFYDQGLADPVRLIQVWRGGLSFHGGLLGVVAATWLFAKRRGISYGRVADACSLGVTPGIFAVRMANFINGELFGRVTDADTPLAMRFPTDPTAISLMGLDGIHDSRAKELAIQVAYGHRSFESVADELPSTDARGDTIDWGTIRENLDWERIQDQVPYRHPSQLYEGIGEGLVVGALLWLAWRLGRRPASRGVLGPGGYAGLFLVGYGVIRVGIELVRQPDAQFRNGAEDTLGTVFLGLTMGQTLCLGMILAGLVLISIAWRRREVLPDAPEGAPVGGA